MSFFSDRSFSAAALVAGLLCTCISPHASGAEVTIEKIILGGGRSGSAGDEAPGTQGRTFLDFGRAALNPKGELVFQATLDPSDFSNDVGIWSGPAGSLSLVAREGTPAPGIPERSIRTFSGRPLIADAGQVAFGAILDNSDQGIWFGEPASVAPAVLEGNEAPGTGGETFRTFGVLTMNRAGDIAFPARITGSSSRSTGIWSGPTSGLGLVARAGDVAPGTDMLTFRGIDLFRRAISINPDGNVAFFVILSRSAGIFAGQPGSLLPVALRGDPAPGIDGQEFSNIGNPLIGGTGQTVFFSELLPNPNAPSQNAGVFLGDSAALDPVALDGSLAPGTTEPFDFLSNDPVINRQGKAVFRAIVGRGSGVWAGRPDRVKLVARSGDPAPGVAGTTFGGFGFLATNACGERAFSAFLNKPAPLPSTSSFWVSVPGLFVEVVETGDQLEVEPGVFRTVSSLRQFDRSGNDDGLPSAFSDLSQLVFQADFPDGSTGLFLASVRISLSDLIENLVRRVKDQGLDRRSESALLGLLSRTLRSAELESRQQEALISAQTEAYVALNRNRLDPDLKDDIIELIEYIFCKIRIGREQPITLAVR